jgi:hypothetical protein
MCTIIHADYLLATILSTRKSISFSSLRKVQAAIRDSDSNVVVDISSPAVHAALEYYPQIFEKKDDSIARAADANEYLSSKYLEYEFTSAVPENIHQVVKDAIAASVP